ncbi:hypothetical protein LINPERHAP2_LOCUS45165 [Linum perenne]
MFGSLVRENRRKIRLNQLGFIRLAKMPIQSLARLLAQLTFQLLQNGPGSYGSPLTSPFRPIQDPEPSVRSPDSVF